MTEVSFERVVDERLFVGTLQTHSSVFFRLANTVVSLDADRWNKRHYYQLINDADSLESLLDDYGARNNRTYSFFTELVASVRGFSQAGYSIAHLRGRLDSYGLRRSISSEKHEELLSDLAEAAAFVRNSLCTVLESAKSEARHLGMTLDAQTYPDESFRPIVARERLPRNLDVEDLSDEREKIAQVASRYLLACEMLERLDVKRIEDEEARRRFLLDICTEERARVYEATVHNLQSTYDTYVKNTVLETEDPKLPQLRAHASAALHLLEAVTHLTHFYERHENDIRSEAAKRRIAKLVSRGRVQHVTLNLLLYWADRLLRLGRGLAEELLPAYTNAQELEVELPSDLTMHARPAALVVAIVNQHGTPVELEISGQRCNAASILELLVAVGSHPDEKRFVFRGDEKPLRDIALLFRYGLGEKGTDSLPEDLSYLRA